MGSASHSSRPDAALMSKSSGRLPAGHFLESLFGAQASPTELFKADGHGATAPDDRRVGGVPRCREADLTEVAKRVVYRDLVPARLQTTPLGPVGDSGADPLTADGLYARWSDIVIEGDTWIAETGTCSMGLAFTQLPKGARFDNQTLWDAIGCATSAAFGAAVAAPNRRVVLFAGEGSHQLTAQEICQFRRQDLRPVIRRRFEITRFMWRAAKHIHRWLRRWTQPQTSNKRDTETSPARKWLLKCAVRV